MGDEVGKELEASIVSKELAEADSVIPVVTRAEMATVIRVLAEQGFGRNEISRRTGYSTFLVSTIAEEVGVTFDRSKIEQALKARLTDLKLAQMGVAEGLTEDLTHARIMLRTSKDRRDLAFAAKTISDLARSAQALTPEMSDANSVEDAKDFLTDLHQELGKFRDHMVSTGQWDEQGNEIKQEEQHDEP
ncbi:hypothetical protein [Streptomyces anulatus]|uniref:hypothetical protein n=1 Tax=Streptomyces anulatus TaxID=1892 RepID=UPI0033E549A9